MPQRHMGELLGSRAGELRDLPGARGPGFLSARDPHDLTSIDDSPERPRRRSRPGTVCRPRAPYAGLMPPRCYIASPLGFTEPGRDYYERIYLPALAAVVDPVDPWAMTTARELAEARQRGRLAELAREIGRRNAEAIRSCSLLVAYLDGQEVDSGTAAEVGYAAALGLTCFGWRSDLREVGEPGARLNLQLEAFILDSGGVIAATLEELVRELGAAAAPASGDRGDR